MHAQKMAETVGNKYMPIGNLTQMTDDERTLVATWYAQGAATEVDGPPLERSRDERRRETHRSVSRRRSFTCSATRHCAATMRSNASRTVCSSWPMAWSSRRARPTALLPTLPADATVVDYRGKLIVPGFVDTHVHYPQTDMIAAYGEQLLEWLERYTFPAERRFDDPAHAREVADFFLAELLRNGTTTALVFATVHPQSVDAFFEATAARGAADDRRQGA